MLPSTGPRELPEGALAEVNFSTTPRLEGSLALVLILGGTNARWTLSDNSGAVPQTDKIGWNDIPIPASLSAEQQADAAIEYLLNNSLLPFLAQHDIDASRIVCAGASVAGPVVGEGADATISLTNVSFVNSYHLLRRFQGIWASVTGISTPLKLEGIQNDARAAYRGEEVLPGGALDGEEDGLLVICGTGVGTTGKTDGKWDASLDEGGHVVRLSRAGTWEKTTLAGLAEEGFFEDGKFHPARGFDYAEHMLAGPWLAARLIKHLGDKLLLQKMVDEICAAHTEKVSSLEHEIFQISALSPEEMESWAERPPSWVVRDVLSWMFSLSPADAALCEPDPYAMRPAERDHLRSTLVTEAFGFKKIALRQLGEFLHAMVPDGDHACVLVGGVFEALRDSEDAEFCMDMIHSYAELSPDKVRFSRKNAEERESAFVSETLPPRPGLH